MNHFRTTITTKKSEIEINHQDKIALIGSCFSENIAIKLKERKFNVLSNPYGILFNPLSIFTAITEIIQLKTYTKNDLGKHNELFYSFNHHSNFSDLELENVLQNINTQIKNAHYFLKNCHMLFITFGTAWAYTYNKKIVANCHKLPNKQFEKILLSNNQIIDEWQKTSTLLKQFNPKLNIVFTVSPVRHLKDGFEENNLSKAILRTTIHQMGNFYFPSYEIMMDDLRDYRFYKSDMLHPNDDAVNYIWQKFSESYFNDNTQQLNKRIYKLQTAIQHQPRFENTNAHQKHLTFIEQEKKSLKGLGIEF